MVTCSGFFFWCVELELAQGSRMCPANESFLCCCVFRSTQWVYYCECTPTIYKYHWIISVYSGVTVYFVCVMHTSVTGRLWTKIQREYLNVMSAIGESMWSSTLRFKELLVYFTWTDKVKLKQWITVDSASLLVTFPWGVRENKVWRQPRTSSLCFECTWIHFFLGWGVGVMI